MTASTAPVAATESSKVPWGIGSLVVAAVLLGGIGWFLAFDGWWLNSDGSAYLSLGRSVIDGHGLRLPDGEVLAWWDRPAYPVLLTAPWLVRESLEASIWMSRLPLILAAPIVAIATLRFTRSLVATAFAGVVAIAQPWTLLAGGSNFVPDGLTAMAIVAGVVAASFAVVAATTAARVGWLLAALAAVLLAALTKETGAIGFLLVAIVVWVGFARPRRWMVLTALVATVPVVLAGLVVANGDTNSGLLDLPRELVDRMREEAFAGSGWIVVAAVVALAVVAWSVPRATEPLPLAGLVLVAPAIALGLYASGSGLGTRNAALLPYGVALLLGSCIGNDLPGRVMVAARAVAIVAGVALVVALFSAAEARAERASDVAARSWDSVGTRSVADFLRAHRTDGSAACTLQFCSFYWLAAQGNVDLQLVPQFSARLGPESVADLDFVERAGFRGPQSAKPPCTDHPLVVTRSDERFGVIFECALLDEIRRDQPKYVVASGWGGTDTFDAGRLIPYLEANPAFRRVHSTTPAGWPRAVAVYEVVGDPQPLPDAPSYYSATAYEALTGDHARPGVRLLDGACYAETIQAILGRPPGTPAFPDGEPASCAGSLD